MWWQHDMKEEWGQERSKKQDRWQGTDVSYLVCTTDFRFPLQYRDHIFCELYILTAVAVLHWYLKFAELCRSGGQLEQLFFSLFQV